MDRPTASSGSTNELSRTPRVLIVSTGGTIASAGRGALVPTTGGSDLVAAVAGLEQVASIEVEEYSRLLSSQLSLQQVYGLARHLRGRLAEWPSLTGIVVTHGTGTLEESAFLADLLHSDARPIVFTGAMRPLSDPFSDGPLNILNAVRVAASVQAQGRGVLVVLNATIHAARDVYKSHTTSVDTFRSTNGGSLGYVYPDRVQVDASPRIRRTIVSDTPEFDIDLVKFVVGMDARFIRSSIAAGAKGVVIEASGEGNVNDAVAAAIGEAIQHRIVVVICSRCPEGRTYPAYGGTGGGAALAKLGCLFSSFSGPKARMLLMLLLGAGMNRADLEGFLDPSDVHEPEPNAVGRRDESVVR